jgi:hypothetical protein
MVVEGWWNDGGGMVGWWNDGGGMVEVSHHHSTID